MMSPSFMTKIKSAFLMVESLCAITKLVRCSVNWSIAFCVISSVRVSTEDVASSKISIGLFCTIARDSQQLLLTGGNRNAVVEHCVKAVRQRLYKVIYAAGLACISQFLVADVRFVVDEVLANRSLKHPRVLKHHAEQVVHAFPCHLGRRHAVYFYASAAHLIKAHQEVHHSGFACAGGSHDCHLLSRADVGGKVPDDDLVGVVRIAEAHMLKVYLSADVCQYRGLFALVGQLLFLKEVKYVVARRRGMCRSS